MTNDRNPRRAPEATFRPMGEEGGLVVLPTRREIKVLNPVGIKVFSLLDGSRSEDEIVREVAEEFDVTREVAARDVGAFLQELRENGMLAGDTQGSGREGVH